MILNNSNSNYKTSISLGQGMQFNKYIGKIDSNPSSSIEALTTASSLSDKSNDVLNIRGLIVSGNIFCNPEIFNSCNARAVQNDFIGGLLIRLIHSSRVFKRGSLTDESSIGFKYPCFDFTTPISRADNA